ncbi:MAG: site-specific DNA-methyltransferase [Sulfurospirillaceae bacterium]|nr:site-specific DNA-methyltransferase [Sulfurospirillaceae bacterium]
MTTLPLYAQIKQIFLGTEFSSLEGEFLTGKIFEAIEKLDKNFITILLQNQTTKEHFFEVIEDAYIFNQNKLYEFFNAKEYFDNSYTSYTNKIGLIKKDSFIKKFDDVVLAFPYKDCVLEGGMSNEEAKKEEVFYNAIISKDEIDRLFEPKVLTNIAKFDTNGQSTPEQISMDDNLIIKGNNLIALHSLKQRYAGKIKLIYIDPPYNTGNDGFKYNDRFNHSTWLTFMKNRLEIARELLRDDGVIFVSINDLEAHYLKVLMDEIFGKTINGNKNFIADIAHQARTGISNDKVISNNHEHILFYAKNYDEIHKNRHLFGIDRTEKDKKNYDKNDNNGKGNYTLNPVTAPGGEKKGNPYYEILGIQNFWRFSKEKMIELYNQNEVVKVNNSLYQKTYWDDMKDKKKKISTWWAEVGTTQQGTIELKKLFNKKNATEVFSNPKASSLIKHVINFCNLENEIILDFHAGSGTTGQAVLDINKEQNKNLKFILIEQMDYIESITCERVKKVIEKNQEGSFIYAELKTIDTFNEADTIGRLNDNMRYLPLGEIDDESYGISESEKALNKQFYGVK